MLEYMLAMYRLTAVKYAKGYKLALHIWGIIFMFKFAFLYTYILK